MSDLIRTILIMSIAGGIIALLLFILKPLTRNRLPKSVQYYLWLLVIVALLVPVSRFFTLETPLISETVENYAVSANEQIDANQHLWLSEFTNLQGERLSKSGSGYASTGLFGEPFVYERKNSDGDIIFKTSVITTLFTVFMSIHPVVTGAILLYFLISYFIFARLHQRRNTLAPENEKTILTVLCGESRSPQLYRNPLASTPMLLGIFRPAIILPDREYTDTQLNIVLQHELTHLRRKDILVKWLSVFACAIHWFNPIVWLVRREIDRACELSCDEAVIRSLDADGKQSYGDTLIYVAADSKTPHAILSTTMCEEKKALKERLGAIMKSKKHTRFTIIVSVMLIFAAIGTTMTLGAGTKEAIHNFNGIFINDVGVDVKATEGTTVELYETGIERLTIFRAYSESEDDNYVIREAFDIKDIRGIEEFFGKGTRGTYSDSQGLKYVRYTGVNGTTATFIYIDGIDEGIENRLERAVITPPTSDNSSPPQSWWSKLFTSTSSEKAILAESVSESVFPKYYFLENATDKQKMERLLSVTLNSDGTAILAVPPISSYLMPNLNYTIVGSELLIHAVIVPGWEDAYGLNNGDIIVKFTVVDEDTLVFKEASVTLFADENARYVKTDSWIYFDGKTMTVYADNIPQIDVFHVRGEQANRWNVELRDEIESFAYWANNLILEKSGLPAGQHPDTESGEGYIFKTSFGGYLFEYGKDGNGDHYVYIGGEWYHIKNPSDPF